jgi:hypothetical protein
MAKKKVKPAPAANEDPLTYGMPQPQKRPGRQPKPPATLAAALDDIESHTAAWIRRFDDVWFSTTTIPLLEIASKASTYDGMPERYDNAIRLLRLLADRAKDGITRLKAGKAVAEKNLAETRTSRGKPKSAKNPSSAPEITEDPDYFGLKGG